MLAALTEPKESVCLALCELCRFSARVAQSCLGISLHSLPGLLIVRGVLMPSSFPQSSEEVHVRISDHSTPTPRSCYRSCADQSTRAKGKSLASGLGLVT